MTETIYYLVKKCSKCKVEKTLDCYHKRNDSKDGKAHECKMCNKKRAEKYYQKNKERLKEKQRQWHWDNLEKSREQSKKWYAENSEYSKQRTKEWAANNPERRKEISNRYARNNRHVIRKWEDDNREYYRKYKREYISKKYREDINYRLKSIMRANLRRILKDVKDTTTVEMLGYNPEQLKKKIEMQFTDGMCWEKMGSEIHIDHKIPVQHFLDKGETRPHIISALSNLQPMWAIENCRKQDKLHYISSAETLV